MPVAESASWEMCKLREMCQLGIRLEEFNLQVPIHRNNGIIKQNLISAKILSRQGTTGIFLENKCPLYVRSTVYNKWSINDALKLL